MPAREAKSIDFLKQNGNMRPSAHRAWARRGRPQGPAHPVERSPATPLRISPAASYTGISRKHKDWPNAFN